MKTDIKTSIGHCVGRLVLAALIVGFYPQAKAELTEAQYEADLRANRKDFEKVVAERRKIVLEEEESAERRRLRRDQEQEHLELVRQTFVASHKPYSMQETEAADRKDELRLQQETQERDEERMRFIQRRERLEAIGERVGPLDPYLELDIDFKNGPDSKVSGAETAKHN